MEGIGQKKETDYIFDKTIKCDVCGKEFKTKQIRTCLLYTSDAADEL